jgi:hypothetical protein
MLNINNFSFMKKILILLALTVLGGQSFSYTFDEEVLERCGQKHPNDIAGRIICNNRVQKELCLKREEREINARVEDLISTIQKKEISNLNDASELINTLSDLKNQKLTAKIIDRSDNAKGTDGKVLRVLISSIQSKCTGDQYYLLNLYQNKDRILTGARVWIRSASNNTNDENAKKEVRFVNLDWDRSIYEIENIKEKIENERIKKIRTDECKKNTQRQYKNLNEILVKAFPDNKTPAEKETISTISKIFSDDDYSVDSVKENADTNSITILPKCDGIFPEISITYQFDYTKGKIQTLQSALLFGLEKQDATKPNYLWKSKGFKENERIENDRIEAQRKKEEAELKKKQDEDNQNRETFISRVLMSLFICIGAALIWFLYERQKKKKILEEHHSKNSSNADLLNERQFVSIRREHASVNQSDDKKTSVTIKQTPLSLPQKATTYSDDDKVLMEDFRSKNPFVKIDVPPSLFNQFIQECNWLEEKTKIFPDKENQVEILKSLIK